MKSVFTKHIPILVATVAVAFGGLASAQKKKDIVDTAVGAGQFNTLVAAVKAAGLVDTLKGKGPYTVFAPTDAAFAKLPKGTVESLLKPENKAKLVDILTYHVVSGNVPSKTAVTLSEANAVNGKKLRLKVRGGKLFINESKVTTADVAASNGVIHIVDSVILPPSPKQRSAAMEKPTVKSLVHTALHEGGVMYQHHNIRATSAIYEITAKALLLLPEGQVSSEHRDRLSNALQSTKHHNHRNSAWVLYQALNSMR